MTLAERFSSERHLWFPKSALIMLLILQKTEQAADLLYARPAELLALTAVFPACFALGFFPARKRKETDAGGERQGRFLMELVILPVILSCAFLPGKLRLPAYVPGGSAAWILCGLVLCAALCWFAGCILRRMMLSEDGTAAKGFFPLIAAGGAFGCLLDLIRAESGPQMILCLLLAHFFLVCAVYFRVIRAHAARCGIPLLFTLVLFGFTGWKFHAELMFRPADDGTPVGRVRIPGAGSISLFTGARLTKGEGGIRIFSRGAAVDRRKELRESGPGDVLPLLALPLQDETSDKPRTAVLVTMFASPLAHQLKLLPLIGRMDIFAVGLEEIFMRGGMVTPDRIPAAAAGHDLMILDLPLPSVPALNYIYTRNCFEAI